MTLADFILSLKDITPERRAEIWCDLNRYQKPNELKDVETTAGELKTLFNIFNILVPKKDWQRVWNKGSPQIKESCEI